MVFVRFVRAQARRGRAARAVPRLCGVCGHTGERTAHSQQQVHIISLQAFILDIRVSSTTHAVAGVGPVFWLQLRIVLHIVVKEPQGQLPGCQLCFTGLMGTAVADVVS